MTHATDEDIVAAIVDYLLTDMRYVRGPLTPIIENLRNRYGRKLVDRALGQYARALRQEQRRLKRQVARAKADWTKRQSEGRRK